MKYLLMTLLLPVCLMASPIHLKSGSVIGLNGESKSNLIDLHCAGSILLHEDLYVLPTEDDLLLSADGEDWISFEDYFTGVLSVSLDQEGVACNVLLDVSKKE